MATRRETYYLVKVSGPVPDDVTDEVNGIIEFVINGGSEVTTSTTGPFSEDVEFEEPDDPIIESPSAWSYRESQENGDRVDCRACGDPLDDNQPIVNDAHGFAFHEGCLDTPKE